MKHRPAPKTAPQGKFLFEGTDKAHVTHSETSVNHQTFTGRDGLQHHVVIPYPDAGMVTMEVSVDGHRLIIQGTSIEDCARLCKKKMKRR